MYEEGYKTITCAGHCYNSPVQCLRKSIKHCVWLIFFQSIAKTSKYQHAHAHCHAQQQQLSEDGKLVVQICYLQNMFTGDYSEVLFQAFSDQ